MGFRQAKSIQELYDEVKEMDHVITKDISLATALNSRCEKSRLGVFAITPRQAARQVSFEILRRPILNEFETITAIKEYLQSEGKDYSERLIYGEIQNIRAIRRYHLDIDSIKRFLHASYSIDVLEAYSHIDNILDNVMADPRIKTCSLYRDSKVAVIGREMFDCLESAVIPDDGIIEISLFKDDPNVCYNIPEFYRIGNDRQLAEHAVSLISGNPADHAIVFDTSNHIADCVRNALYCKSIPFVNKPAVSELSVVRRYLRFIELSLRFDKDKVSDIIELFTESGLYVERSLAKLTLENALPMMSGDTAKNVELMRSISKGRKRFSDVRYIVREGDDRDAIDSILEYVGDRKIDEESLSMMRYILSNVSELDHNIKSITQRTGVLLADCKKAMFIDRPSVIYLGMGQEWDIPINTKEYSTMKMVENDTAINCERFTVMLQQGTSRRYLVNVTKDGKESRPALTFSEILGRPTKDFKDIDKNVIEGRWVENSTPVELSLEVKGTEEYNEKFSKSSFNQYFYCPCRFALGRVLSTPDNDWSVFGTAVHAFAEFYACYRDEYRDDISDIIDALLKIYPNIVDDPWDKYNANNFRRHIDVVKEFLDRLDLSDIRPESESKPMDNGRDPRPLFTAMGKNMHSPLCETEEFVSEQHMIKGKMDLFTSGTVYDYKTGNVNSMNTIINNTTCHDCTENKREYDCEFQPAFYLALARENGSDKGAFTLFQTKGDMELEKRFKTISLDGVYPNIPFELGEKNVGSISSETLDRILYVIDDEHAKMIGTVHDPIRTLRTAKLCANCDLFRYCVHSKDLISLGGDDGE